MSVTIQLPPQVESEVTAAARERGVTVDELISEVLLYHGPRFGRIIHDAPTGEARKRAVAEFKQQMNAIAAKAKGIPQESLSDIVEETIADCRFGVARGTASLVPR